MNYIVFDLEWNQNPDGRRHPDSRLPFEIIEIGAVKLNEKFDVIYIDPPYNTNEDRSLIPFSA